MRRFLLLLRMELKMIRTAPIVHLIAILQPSIMYMLMSVIMVVPTFDLYVVEPKTEIGLELVAALEEVGSPIGPDYINPILVPKSDPGHRQVIEIVGINGEPTALQRYGYIDSNLVKNLRNRLKAALLILWENELGSQAVTIEEAPWLPYDAPYTVYFGMAMIPLAAYFAAAMIGGYVTAGEFENNTILEYRLSPTSYLLLLGAKVTRSMLFGLSAAAILYTTLGLITGVWSSSTPAVFLILMPLTLIAANIGLIAGLLLRSSLPAFLVALASAFGFWLLGSGFGLAAGFSDLFESISRLIPNTPVIEMLFPYFYYGRQVAANPARAVFQLSGYCLLLLVLLVVVYHRRVLAKGR